MFDDHVRLALDIDNSIYNHFVFGKRHSRLFSTFVVTSISKIVFFIEFSMISISDSINLRKREEYEGKLNPKKKASHSWRKGKKKVKEFP